MRLTTIIQNIKTLVIYTVIFVLVVFVTKRKHATKDISAESSAPGQDAAGLSYEERMRRVEVLQEDRQKQLRKTCAELGFSDPTEEQQLKAVRPLVVYEPHKTLICLMAKVASTGWKVELMLQSNRTDVNRKYLSHTNTSFWVKVYDKNILKTYGIYPPNDYSGEDQLYRIKNYFSFVFTRHPLERQVSAYRNKLEFANKQAYDAFYGMVRGKKPEHFNGTSDISFEEFITFVVGRLNSGKGVNEHLDTYQHLCSPCVLNYRFIGDMATMRDDVTYVINKMTNRKYMESMFSQNSPETTHESEKLFLKYYRNLDANLVKEIDKVFDMDYRLFGYKKLSTLLQEENKHS